ncbi:hypothetical protein P692DRAFT_201808419 [Suillus brevipes Sb2]|nr:hypothetical protein P692DRAFT_201808419 [Suillus brevipes Sb2]
MSNRKRKYNLNFGTINETIITDTDTFRTSRANLSKVRADRLALERENMGSRRELSAATREVLAEAAIYANKYSDDVGDSIMNFGDVVGAGVAMDGDAVDSDDSTEENEVSAARVQKFNSIQGIFSKGSVYCTNIFPLYHLTEPLSYVISNNMEGIVENKHMPYHTSSMEIGYGKVEQCGSSGYCSCLCWVIVLALGLMATDRGTVA